MPAHQKTLHTSSLIIPTLIITIVVDVMGMGLVFPIIPSLIMGHSAILVSTSTPANIKMIFYGLAMGAWPAGIFFGTPFLGELSDRVGRKRILLFCLSITAFAYGLACVAILQQSFLLFLLARFLAGFSGGSFTIAQAVITDISRNHQKARNLGWITLAASIGIIIGPAISSIAVSNTTLSRITMPFWIAMVLALLNCLSLWILLKETHTPTNNAHLKLQRMFTSFTFIITDKRTWLLAVTFFLLELGWGFYIQEIPLVLTQLFHFNARSLGLVFTGLGIAMMVGVLFIQPLLLKHFPLKPLCIASAIMQALLFTLVYFMPTLGVNWSVVILGAIGNLLCYTCCLTLFSDAVTTKEQGQVMGGTGCIFGAAWMLNALLLGPLMNINLLLPLLLAALCILASGAVISPYQPKGATNETR